MFSSWFMKWRFHIGEMKMLGNFQKKKNRKMFGDNESDREGRLNEMSELWDQWVYWLQGKDQGKCKMEVQPRADGPSPGYHSVPPPEF